MTQEPFTVMTLRKLIDDAVLEGLLRYVSWDLPTLVTMVESGDPAALTLASGMQAVMTFVRMRMTSTPRASDAGTGTLVLPPTPSASDDPTAVLTGLLDDLASALPSKLEGRRPVRQERVSAEFYEAVLHAWDAVGAMLTQVRVSARAS